MTQTTLAAVPDRTLDHEAEWTSFWNELALIASQAIRSVSVDHPDGDLLRSVCRDCRIAAGLPPARAC